MSTTRCSVIVLTMGDRNNELFELIGSLPDPGGFEGILIGNGVAPPQVHGWRCIELAENVGISAGRRHGGAIASGDVLVFLDDDARVRTTTLLQDITAAFNEHDGLGAIALRVVVTDTEESLPEWQPRICGRGDRVAGSVTSFHGAAHAIRATAYDKAGGYQPDLFYAHEETDLAWRLLDDRWEIAYRPDLTLEHPRTKPSRHSGHLWYSARNRIWLARQHLPLPWAVSYSGLWLVIQLVRARRSLTDARAVLRGTAAGLRDGPPRQPMSWRTTIRMTRLGRPPLI